MKKTKTSMTEVSDSTLSKHCHIPHKILSDFFLKLNKSIKKQNLNLINLESNLNEISHYTLPDFTKKIQSFTNISEFEIENVFNLISNGEVVHSSVFLKELKKASEDSDSSESCDISSPSNEEYVENDIDEAKISNIFELLSFKFKSNTITSQDFSNHLIEAVGEHATPLTLNKFFLRKEFRIEEGVERNMLIKFLLGDKDKIHTPYIIQIFIEKCFSYDIKEIKYAADVSIKSHFQDESKKLDKRRTGYLSWDQILIIFEIFQIQPTKDLKFFCYNFEKSLDAIPYNLL